MLYITQKPQGRRVIGQIRTLSLHCLWEVMFHSSRRVTQGTLEARKYPQHQVTLPL